LKKCQDKKSKNQRAFYESVHLRQSTKCKRRQVLRTAKRSGANARTNEYQASLSENAARESAKFQLNSLVILIVPS
jgi:hypothetical protein